MPNSVLVMLVGALTGAVIAVLAHLGRALLGTAVAAAVIVVALLIAVWLILGEGSFIGAAAGSIVFTAVFEIYRERASRSSVVTALVLMAAVAVLVSTYES